MAAITTTTLSAAITSDDTRELTPASMTGIVLGDILFIGREAMVVQEVKTSTVVVQRGLAGTRVRNHIASDRIYHGPTEQFEQRDPEGDESSDDTPWINIMNGSIWSQGKDSVWRRWSDGGRAGRPVYEYSADGAISVEEGTHILQGSDTAYTLAAPTVDQDGMRLHFVADAAAAFVITATGLLRGDSGGTDDNTATFGGAIGDNFQVIAQDGIWLLLGTPRNITFA